ncbi:helix-turn-helix transcriptional regulator [Pukyongiella litopenaei]|nr:helix-turn-helix domain-containing protein [Pukyongiella litopenaei]
MAVHRDFPPRLMPAPAAAHYIGVSESTLRTLNLPRRKLGAKRVYDRADLDAYADALPYDGAVEELPEW